MVTDEQARLVRNKAEEFGTAAVARFLKECDGLKGLDCHDRMVELQGALEIVETICSHLALDEGID